MVVLRSVTDPGWKASILPLHIAPLDTSQHTSSPSTLFFLPSSQTLEAIYSHGFRCLDSCHLVCCYGSPKIALARVATEHHLAKLRGSLS